MWKACSSPSAYRDREEEGRERERERERERDGEGQRSKVRSARDIAGFHPHLIVPQLLGPEYRVTGTDL